MSVQSDQLVQNLKSLQADVGGWETRKEVAKAEVDSLLRQRAKLFEELEQKKQAHQAELDKRMNDFQKVESKHKESVNKLAQDQADFITERRSYLEEKAAFNSERNALMEKVKAAQDRIKRLENFLKIVDAERGRV